MFLFHKYLLIYLFSMYDSYTIIIFAIMDFTNSQTMNFLKKNQNFNFLSQIYFITLLSFYN
jgi:hypothetical protein